MAKGWRDRRWAPDCGDGGYPARGGYLAAAGKHHPPLCAGSMGTAVAEATRERAGYHGEICGRQRIRIRASGQCRAVSGSFAGTLGEVWSGVTPGQNAADRIRALRDQEPAATWRGEA